MSRDHVCLHQGLAPAAPWITGDLPFPLVCPMGDAGSHPSLWELRDPRTMEEVSRSPPPRTVGG